MHPGTRFPFSLSLRLLPDLLRDCFFFFFPIKAPNLPNLPGLTPTSPPCLPLSPPATPALHTAAAAPCLSGGPSTRHRLPETRSLFLPRPPSLARAHVQWMLSSARCRGSGPGTEPRKGVRTLLALGRWGRPPAPVLVKRGVCIDSCPRDDFSWHLG